MRLQCRQESTACVPSLSLVSLCLSGLEAMPRVAARFRRSNDSAMRLPQGRKRPSRPRRRLKHTRSRNRCQWKEQVESQRQHRHADQAAQNRRSAHRDLPIGVSQRAHCARTDSPPTLSPGPFAVSILPQFLIVCLAAAPEQQHAPHPKPRRPVRSSRAAPTELVSMLAR
jgi:hypothetical protein